MERINTKTIIKLTTENVLKAITEYVIREETMSEEEMIVKSNFIPGIIKNDLSLELEIELKELPF